MSCMNVDDSVFQCIKIWCDNSRSAYVQNCVTIISSSTSRFYATVDVISFDDVSAH